MSEIKTYSWNDQAPFEKTYKWDLAFIGTDIDERGGAAVACVRSQTKDVVRLSFNPESQALFCENKETGLLQLRAKMRRAESILVEATTLGFVEILKVIHALHAENKSRVDILYLEPIEYTRSSQGGVLGREFSLSGNRRFVGVRGFMLDLSTFQHGQLVFLLGYEGARLRQAFEQLEVQAWTKYAVFGVPGFAAGWEMNSFANNIEQIQAGNFALKYCSASSVSAAYSVLKDIYDAKPHGEDPTVVIPIGTKPHSIATALFLCDYPNFQTTGLIYDHPERSDGRSAKIRRWHLYKVTLGAPRS